MYRVRPNEFTPFVQSGVRFVMSGRLRAIVKHWQKENSDGAARRRALLPTTVHTYNLKGGRNDTSIKTSSATGRAEDDKSASWDRRLGCHPYKRGEGTIFFD